MEIKEDREVDTKYVLLKRGKVVKTQEVQDWLFYDFAKNGELLGIEILDASKHQIVISTVKDRLTLVEEIKSSQPKEEITSYQDLDSSLPFPVNYEKSLATQNVN